MGRKSKARSDENAKASKKVKVSEEEVNDDDGPWDGIRVIVDHVICRSDACGQKATAAWVSQKTGDEWAMCNDCQLRDFGECYTGEPLLDNKAPEALEQGEEPDEKQITPKKNDYSRMVGDKTSVTAEEGNSSESPELPIDQPPTVSDDSSPSESPSVASLETMQEEVDTDVPAGPAVTQTQEETPSLPESEGTDGQYDLKKILSLEDLQKDDTICCSQENCDLSAFGLYVNSCHPKDRWYYCLDCQENDFDGWPPVEELPVNYMEPKHIRVMALKCSSRKNPRMPVFSSSSPEGKVEPIANFVTPPPPSKENTLLLNTKEIGPPPKVAGKAKAIEVHKKWLEAAQAMGGKDARIVVSKPAAKKMIFDFLYDSFQPMNITQIFQGLLAVVPQPVLNICLQEMVPDNFSGKNIFEDSDGEEDTKGSPSSENKEPYSASLVFKVGKNLSTNLYFTDYTKVKGMERLEQETLMTDLATAKAEQKSIKANLNSTREVTSKLLAEPTNEELTLKLEAAEKNVQELEEKIVEARKLKVNEKHKEKTKKRIENMAAQWRQRRRSCLEFLTTMEENTDGAVSRSKCLKGDGQIAIDSDEAVAKAAIEHAKEKRDRAAKGGLQRRKSLSAIRAVGKGGSTVGLESNVVAVTLDAQLNIVRIYGNQG